MKTSQTVTNIGTALLKAQMKMGGAKKGASNPYFKSKYADLGSVLEACKELLNEYGIVILQPHSNGPTNTTVETILLHESGEWISSETPVVCAKQNDPQALGSAITYARRYGLQSLLSMPAEDDDGESAMSRQPKTAPKAAEAPKMIPAAQGIDTAPVPEALIKAAIEAQAIQTPKKSSFRNKTAKPAETVAQQAAPTEDLGLD